MPRNKPINKNVTWLSKIIPNEQKFTTFHYYKKFQFKKIVGEIGDFVLISNADAAGPDTEGGCDAAKILALYEDSSNNNNPFRAKVQWYSKPDALPKGCYNQAEPINFYCREVFEDHRPFDTDVSIETFFKKCSVICTFTRDTDDILHNQKYAYICRYRLMPLGRGKTYLEPVLEEERKAIELLCTPRKNITPNTPKTPNSLVKRMSRVSISDKNWSVPKSDGTKLLHKRAISADKTEKDTPKVTTRKRSKSTSVIVVTASPKSSKESVEAKSPKKPKRYSVEEKLRGNNKPKNATLKISADKTEKDTPKVTTRKRSKSTSVIVVTTSPQSSKESVEAKSPKKPKRDSVEEKLRGNNKPKNATLKISADKTEKDTPKVTTRKRSKSTSVIVVTTSPQSSKESVEAKSPKKPKRDSVEEKLRGNNKPKNATLKISADKTEKDTPKVTTRKRSKSTSVIVVTTSPKSLEAKSPKKPKRYSVEEKLRGNNKPKNATLKSLKLAVETPKSSKKLNKNNIEEILSMELRENSLIIQQNAVTPKRKTPQRKICNETPKKVLVFENEEDTNIPRETPTRRSAQKSSESEDDFKSLPKIPKVAKTPKTPKTPKTSIAKTPRTPRTSIAKTPKSGTRRINISQLTPTLQKRAHPIENIDKLIIENKSLPGRERHLREILTFVRMQLLHGRSGCMYISGVPGTGKTATVEFALKALKEEQEVPEFQLVEVNGMMIAEPRQAYVQIYKQLTHTGKSVGWERACALLEKRFTNPGPRSTPTVLVVDELDALCNRRQDVLYSIMEWATHNTALLTVLAIANTIDLPERVLKPNVASRLGITRLSFGPYSHNQLQCIVATRLVGAKIIPDALQLIARKVAAVSGDARRAISLCERALELAAPNCAGLREVQLALEEATTSDTVRAIRCCAPAERLILRAMAAEVERTGSDETTMSRMLVTAATLAALDGRPYRSAPDSRGPTCSQAHALCASLSAMQLIHMERKRSEPRLMLNCSVDDVYYATKKITV
ncbi:origin recognition complex subunit 1-like isoform X1 [Maniola jurtina]|uniref:origin recognition complex subunit 1-like isoform X1 n=1 Tax=Maniola jurtina TaxID=191418 RepID=UPI001E68744D|nr:origin recognition complex subunit 1-like isoform X1 [Maniola jurtina]